MQRQRTILTLGVILVLAFLEQVFTHGITDISWLITADIRMMHGQRLYTDIMEVNPPASPLLYFLPAWVALSTGLVPEHVITAAVIVEIGISFWLAGRMLMRNDLVPRPQSMAVAAALAFALVAGASFGQRDHIALIALLPTLALTACRMQGAARTHLHERILSGIGAGIAMSIKPHFALAIALPQIFAAWSSRSIRPLVGVENWVAAIFVATYFATIATIFPHYFSDMLPILLETYRPARMDLPQLLTIIAPFVFFIASYCYVTRNAVLSRKTATPLLAALGFLLGYFEQAKGWPYHYYPCVALLLFVVLTELFETLIGHLERGESPLRGHGMRIAVAGLFLLTAAYRFMYREEASVSLEPVISRQFSHPRILAVSGDLGVGFPLTREIGGVWLGRVPSQWLTETSQTLLDMHPDMTNAARQHLATQIALDRAWFRDDFEKGHPDVLLVDRRRDRLDWKAWLLADPVLARHFGEFTLLARNDKVDAYVRRHRAD